MSTPGAVAAWSQPLPRAYRQRWRIWFVAVLSHSLGVFHRAAMGPMADRIMADFDVTAVAFGSLGAVYFYVYAGMQLPSGTLADTLGPRKSITMGLLITTVGAVVMGLAPTFEVLYIGRVIATFGASFEWLSVLKIVMNWYRAREVATVTGLSGSVNNMGQLLAATPLALLIGAIGWRMSILSVASLSLGLAIITWFVIKESPAKAGLKSLAELDGEPPEPEAGANGALGMWQRIVRVLSDKRLWPLFLVTLGTYGAYCTFFLNWLVVYMMQTYGVDRAFAATFALVSAVGAIVGTPLLGLISDRTGTRRAPMAVATGISLACYLAITLWNGGKPPIETMWFFSFAIGFNVGAMPVGFGAVRDLAKPEVRGISSGLVNMGGFVGAAIIQPLFGWALDHNWTGQMVDGVRHYPVEAFQKALFLCCGLIALGFIGALTTKEPHTSRVR
jgi:sugar phosphate permease